MAPENDEEKPLIPKFSSFKPKASTKSKRNELQDPNRSENRSRERENTDHAYRSRKAESPRDRKQYDSRPSSQSSKPKQAEQSEPDVFTINKRGDRYNVEYGTPHRYDVPFYYRIGSGRILGLRNSCIIDRELSLGNTIVIYSRGRGDRAENYREKYNSPAWKKASKIKELRRVRSSPVVKGNSESPQDFIALTSGDSRKRRKLESKTHSADTRPDYRSIEGKAKPSDFIAYNEDLTSDSGLESEGETLRQRNTSLSLRTSTHPHDIDGWIDLINHQDSLVGTSDWQGHHNHTSAEKRSIADIKISMYEDALGKIPDDAPRDRLLLGIMKEGATIWDTKTLTEKWKATLHSHPEYVTLWVKYLDFQQTQFINFTYEDCRSIFLECLNINQTHSHASIRSVINIYILLRLSLFMHEAGYHEQAVALWQANLEFNFCRPCSLSNSSHSVSVQSFGEFWDSEIPRLGEIGAKGWGDTESEPPSAKSDPPIAEINRGSLFESWLQLEQSQIHNCRLPARTLDEVQEDDPYRVILSNDISELLLSVPEAGLLTLLLDAFLLFCRLPPHFSGQHSDVLNSWCEDPFIRNLIFEQANNLSRWFASVSDDMRGFDKPLPTSFPYSRFLVTEDTIFADGQCWFASFELWKSVYVDDIGPLDTAWVRRTLRQLVDRLPDNENLAIYSIGLEFICNASDSIKYSKGLLRKRPSSIGLYNAYALIENRRGNGAAAEKVWTTALSMRKTFSEEHKHDFVLLWRSWLWKLLADNSNQKSIQLLLAIADTDFASVTLSGDGHTDINPVELLKIQKALVESQNHGLSFRNSTVFVNNTDCLALLFYLTQNFSIQSALDVYNSAENRLEANGLAHTPLSEALQQSKARLLWHHISRTQKYKPALIRSELNKSLRLFPNNTIFLSVFAYNESRFKIDDRVRLVVRHHISDAQGGGTQQPPLTPHFFSIYNELHRSVSIGSTVHSARAAFETAVSSPPGQHSAALWKLFVLFELELGEGTRARETFYRSIRSCPWAKGLIMLAFSEPGLRNLMYLDERRKIWNVFTEKGLRIHVDLEEILDEMEQEIEQSRGPPKISSADMDSDEEL